MFSLREVCIISSVVFFLLSSSPKTGGEVSLKVGGGWGIKRKQPYGNTTTTTRRKTTRKSTGTAAVAGGKPVRARRGAADRCCCVGRKFHGSPAADVVRTYRPWRRSGSLFDLIAGTASSDESRGLSFLYRAGPPNTPNGFLFFVSSLQASRPYVLYFYLSFFFYFCPKSISFSFPNVIKLLSATKSTDRATIVLVFEKDTEKNNRRSHSFFVRFFNFNKKIK